MNILLLFALGVALFLGYLYGLATVRRELDARELRQTLDAGSRARDDQRAISAIERAAVQQMTAHAARHRTRTP